jgi:hypothetical protein
MKDYKRMLIERSKKAAEAAPLEPEKPLTWTQYHNKLNTEAWRKKMREFMMSETWQ